ncbi:MAG: AAA family ATPase [Phycisphaerae bacterium]|nr:AAA family ATPase [Phycisphaerae bacterium]
MITRFGVKNYKALRDISLDLTPLHALIGPNDSGKTSILEALAALCKSVDSPLRQIFPAGTAFTELLWEGSLGGSVSIGCGVADGEFLGTYSFDCAPAAAATTNLCAQQQTWTPDGKNPIDLHPTAGLGSTAVHWGTTMPHLSGTEKILAGNIRNALSGVALFRWNASMLRLPVILEAQRRFTMDISGFGLAQCLDDILGLDREQFRQLELKFCAIFPEVKSIQLVAEMAYQWPTQQTADGMPHLMTGSGKGISFQLRNGHSIRAAQASDGLLLTLAYLTLLFLPQPPRVILVQEPENGIHPRRLQGVLKILRQLLSEHSRTQILLTTHSPYLLDCFQPEEVTLCRKEPDGSVSVHPLQGMPEVRKQLAVFSLGEIWTAEGDDALAKSTNHGAT